MSAVTDWQTLSDAELLASNEPDAFAELIGRHQTIVFGAAFRVLRDPVAAEDIAQEALLRAFRSRSTFDGSGSARGWLYTIAKNLALNAVTRTRETPSATLPDQEGGTRPDEAVLRQVEITDVREAIAALPEHMREPLILHEFKGVPYADIAEQLDVPVNTVRTRIFRAKRALGDLLGAEEDRK